MADLDLKGIIGALTAVGELLDAMGERVAIVVTGGATLSLLGVVDRGTRDVDVIARAWRDDRGKLRLREPEPLPVSLAEAIHTVARDFGLDEDWMNAAVGRHWAQGLPPWITDDIRWTNFGGGLDVGLVGRRTLIALKLFAAVDQRPESVHSQDLLALRPNDAELEEAQAWVLTQDAAPVWSYLVNEVVAHVERHR